MSAKIITTAVALTILCATAIADFNTVTRAHEIALSSFRLPISPSGTLGIRKCANCEQGAYRVTTSTRYTVNGSDVDLREFRRLMLQIKNRDRVAVTVMHHLESDTISQVLVSLPDAD